MFKEEIRILGFDDGPFDKNSKSVPVVGVIFRGGKFMDGMLKTEVEVDGLDSTEKLINLINSSRHKEQLKVIMLDGITFGGFNLVDIKELNKRTELPVIVINRKIPNLKDVKNALKNFEDFEKRWRIVKNAGKIKAIKIKERKIFYQCKGLEDEEACEIIELSSTHSFIPEPLRIAHLIAGAIVRGESFGRA
jgi:endonuclease V-like protein UPF0215 family